MLCPYKRIGSNVPGSEDRGMPGCKAGDGPGRETDLSVVAAMRHKPNAQAVPYRSPD
jgi:hypothetical protein